MDNTKDAKDGRDEPGKLEGIRKHMARFAAFIDAGAMYTLKRREVEAWMVYFRYADNDTGKSFPSIDTIAQSVCPGSPSRAREAVRGLERAGWLKLVSKGGGFKNPSIYRLTHPNETGASAAPPNRGRRCPGEGGNSEGETGAGAARGTTGNFSTSTQSSTQRSSLAAGARDGADAFAAPQPTQGDDEIPSKLNIRAFLKPWYAWLAKMERDGMKISAKQRILLLRDCERNGPMDSRRVIQAAIQNNAYWLCFDSVTPAGPTVDDDDDEAILQLYPGLKRETPEIDNGAFPRECTMPEVLAAWQRFWTLCRGERKSMSERWRARCLRNLNDHSTAQRKIEVLEDCIRQRVTTIPPP